MKKGRIISVIITLITICLLVMAVIKIDILEKEDTPWLSSTRIVTDSENNSHIVWTDHRDDVTGIYYTKLDPKGKTITNDKRITNKDDSSSPMKLLIDSKENLHLLWIGYYRDIEREGLYHAKFDLNGNRISTEQWIFSYNHWTDYLLQDKVTIDNEDNIYFVDYNRDSGINFYNVTKIDSNGNMIYSKFVDKKDDSGKIIMTNYTNTNILSIKDHRVAVDSFGIYISLENNLVIDSNNNLHFINEIRWNKLTYFKMNSSGVILNNQSIKFDLSMDNPKIAIDDEDFIYLTTSLNFKYISYTKMDNDGNIIIPTFKIKTSDISEGYGYDEWFSIAVDDGGSVGIVWVRIIETGEGYHWRSHAHYLIYSKINNNGDVTVKPYSITTPKEIMGFYRYYQIELIVATTIIIPIILVIISLIYLRRDSRKKKKNKS